MGKQMPVKRGRGRPKTDVKWIGIGIRFTEAEKPRLARVSNRLGLSQAKFIRRATLSAISKVESGKAEALPDSLPVVS